MEPEKLAIYYGWPSTVNATYSVAGAAGVFKDYESVVFGAGLEKTSHGDHDNTQDIIDHTDMASTNVYGYVDANKSSLGDIKTDIDDWHTMGIHGIFVDQFGYDYGNVDRTRQNDVVQYIHDKTSPTLVAFVNAWDVDDALGNAVDQTKNPSGTAHKLNTTDWYLVESFAVKNNAYDDTDTDTDGDPDWKEKADKLITTYSGDIKVAAIGTTGSSSAGFTQAKADYSYAATAMYGFNSWGWGEKNYSSAGGADSLPLRTRWTLPEGSALHGSISKTGNKYQRNTDVGFQIDISAHTVSTRLN